MSLLCQRLLTFAFMTRFHSETMSVDTSALKRVQNLGDHNFAVHSNINRREGETDSRIHLTSLSCSLLLLQVMWSPARAAKAHSLQVTTQCKQMCDSYYTVAIKSTSDWKFDFICMITTCKDDVKTMSRVLLVVRQRIITRACSSLAWWSFIVSFSSLFFFFFIVIINTLVHHHGSYCLFFFLQQAVFFQSPKTHYTKQQTDTVRGEFCS